MAHLFGYRSGYYSAPVALANDASVGLPASRNFVAHVVLLCAIKQVGWVAAERVIARMTTDVRPKAVCQPKGNSVGALSSSTEPNLPIAISELPRCPLPAVARGTLPGCLVHL